MNSFSRNIENSIATPDGKREYNRGLFGRVAHEYDDATRLMSLWQDGTWKKRLVAGLPDIAEPRCVDLACGTGDVSVLLAERYPRGEILGVDLTPEMVLAATARCVATNVRFVESDMCRLDLPDGWADIVTGSYALRNAAQLDHALSEIRRVLKPGGIAAFLDFRKTSNPRVARAQLVLLKYWCGFCSYIVHGAPEHAYIAESLKTFPDHKALTPILNAHGFKVIARRPQLMGMTELIWMQ